MRGYRKPSYKKSFSSRTYGRSTRRIRSAYKCNYGKRGNGYITNPKKASYNYVYNRTTGEFSFSGLILSMIILTPLYFIGKFLYTITKHSFEFPTEVWCFVGIVILIVSIFGFIGESEKKTKGSAFIDEWKNGKND